MYRPAPGTEECQICGDSDASLWGHPSDPACVLLVCTACLCAGKAGNGGFGVVKPSAWLLACPTHPPDYAETSARRWAEYSSRFTAHPHP